MTDGSTTGEKYAGFWAIFSLIGAVPFAGKFVRSIMTGEFAIGPMFPITLVDSPYTFYGIQAVLALFACMCALYSFECWREWRMKRLQARN